MTIPIVNAKTSPLRPKKFLLYGGGGTGKTTAALTLSGPDGKEPRRIGFLFDPASMSALSGEDIDCIEILPDQVNTDVGTMSSKDQIAVRRAQSGADPIAEPKVYRQWQETLEEIRTKNLAANYDLVLVDSMTTFMQIIMDRQTWINQRSGGAPHQDDYLPAMTTFLNSVRDLLSVFRNHTVVFTAHEDYREDKALGRQVLTLMLTGQLRNMVPLLFSEVLRLTVEDGKHWAALKKDARSPVVRSSLRRPEQKLDTTISFGAPLYGAGLGKYYNPAMTAGSGEPAGTGAGSSNS